MRLNFQKILPMKREIVKSSNKMKKTMRILKKNYILT